MSTIALHRTLVALVALWLGLLPLARPAAAATPADPGSDVVVAARVGGPFADALAVAVAADGAVLILEQRAAGLAVVRWTTAGAADLALLDASIVSPTFPAYPMHSFARLAGLAVDRAGAVYLAGQVYDDSGGPGFVYRLTGDPRAPVAAVAESFGAREPGNGGPARAAGIVPSGALRHHAGTDALYVYDAVFDQIRRLDAPFDGTGAISAVAVGVGAVDDLGWDAAGRLHILQGGAIKRQEGEGFVAALGPLPGGARVDGFAFAPDDTLLFVERRADGAGRLMARRPDGASAPVDAAGAAFPPAAGGPLRLAPDGRGALYLLDRPGAALWRLDFGAGGSPVDTRAAR
jgi:hypothetical protein